MLLLTHFIISLVLVAILFPFFSFYSFIALIGGFLIDVDHLIFYYIKFRNLNFRRAHNYFKNIALKEDFKRYKKVVRIFHSIEFIILIIILSFYRKIFFILLIGIIAHLTMDIIQDYPKFKTLKPFSLVYHLKNAKKQEK